MLRSLLIQRLFAQNIHCYPQEVRSTHNVYFGSKIRTLDTPLQTPGFLYVTRRAKRYELGGRRRNEK